MVYCMVILYIIKILDGNKLDRSYIPHVSFNQRPSSEISEKRPTDSPQFCTVIEDCTVYAQRPIWLGIWTVRCLI